GLVVTILSLLVGFSLPHWISIVPAFLIMLLIAILFTSLSTMIGSMLRDMQGFQAVMNFLIMPLFLLSGALYPLEGLPKALAVVTFIDPLSYGIDAMRAVMINSSHFSLGTDVLVLAGFTAVFLFFGGYYFKKIQI
ncbi:MAG TPA: ABC transporter permease, partial [Candidatus Paceibacterota bacterium]|nr:ABC transporter permease [Candidatus Paceibacterota bacterium]